MNMVDLITDKRAGRTHDRASIRELIREFVRGGVPDYQMAAWLMAVCFRGLSDPETTELTLAMAESGQVLDLRDIAPLVADKHSTGGVGDKTTLVVAPLIATLGVPVGKMTGRGLGFSGGTVDKLESFPGLRLELTSAEFRDQLRHIGIVLAAQSDDLAPADGRMYALRDVTGTVDCLALIASSVMSKKIAAGATLIALDVKVGQGAFMKTLDEAKTLARLMVAIGERAGRRTIATISSMEQPLGAAVGNVLEVREAIETLRGGGPDDFRYLCIALAAEVIALAGITDEMDAQLRADAALNDGTAFETFRRLIEGQGGDPADVDDPSRLADAPVVRTVRAPREGVIAAIDAEQVGRLSVRLGAGRLVKGADIDRRVGLVFPLKVGDHADRGQTIAEIHAASDADADRIVPFLLAAYRWSDAPVEPPPLILDRVSARIP